MRWFAGVAIVSLVGVLPFAGSAEAQVDGPTLTVNPSTDIDWRGESVQISVSDRAPGTKAAIGLCRADVPVPPANLADLTTSCTLIAVEITADPYQVTLPIGLSGAQHCVEVGCVIGYIGYTGTIFPQPLNLTYVESAMVPISFTEVDEVPPTHPDFAMTVTPTAGLVHGQSVQVQVVKACVDTFLANELPAYSETCKMLGAADLRDGLSGIKVPTRIVVGEEDYATPVKMAEEMHAGITGSTFLVLPKARHLTPLEQPDTIAAELKQLL